MTVFLDYGGTTHGGGWRKDVVKQYLEFAVSPSADDSSQRSSSGSRYHAFCFGLSYVLLFSCPALGIILEAKWEDVLEGKWEDVLEGKGGPWIV